MKPLILAALIALLAGPVSAQMLCGPRPDVVANLERTYDEYPSSMGLASNGTVIEVFVSEKGSFTVIMTRPDGMSCLMVAGENWENVPPPRWHTFWAEDWKDIPI